MSDSRVVILTASPAPHALPGVRPEQRSPDDDAVARALADAAGARAVVLAEGDVLLRAPLLSWLAAAREGGAKAVAVETTGWALARDGAAQRLAEAGLSHVMVPLFGADAAAHDWVVGQPGAFARALRGLKRARAAGLRTRVVLPILRPTFRTLPDLVRRCLPIGVGGFELRAPAGPDRPAHGLHPHLALAAPYAVRALELARAARRGASCWGVPACLLGDLAGLAVELQGQRTVDAGRGDDGRARTHGPPCEGCVAREGCPGPLASYVDDVGWQGLAALDA